MTEKKQYKVLFTETLQKTSLSSGLISWKPFQKSFIAATAFTLDVA